MLTAKEFIAKWRASTLKERSAAQEHFIDLRRPEAPDRPHPCLPRLREAFAESRLPILVDVLDWAGIPEEFRAEILKGTVEIARARKNPECQGLP